jgi:phosphate starvation-inducible membrane PsiE
MDMTFLLYEAGAILLLSIAVLVVRFKPIKTYNYQTDDEG